MWETVVSPAICDSSSAVSGLLAAKAIRTWQFAEVGRQNRQAEAPRPLVAHQVVERKGRDGGVLGQDRVAVEVEEAQRRRQDTRALVR